MQRSAAAAWYYFLHGPISLMNQLMLKRLKRVKAGHLPIMKTHDKPINITYKAQ